MSITYALAKAKIERDMDIEDRQFIQDNELVEYFNDAIRDCEGQIHKLGLEEIYFLTYDNPSVVSGTAEYNMPTGIFASKLIKCLYNDGNRVFPILEIKGSRRFEQMLINNNIAQNQPIYRYYIRNPSSAGVKWGLNPAPTETSSTRFTRWFIREATKITSAATETIDVPDICLNFIYAYVTWRVWGKEGDARAVDAKNELELQRKLMIEVLSDMTPDEENQVEMDTSLYEDMS